MYRIGSCRNGLVCLQRIPLYSCNLGAFLVEFVTVAFYFIVWQYGIPEWIVRLRHDATHGSLPSLDVLTTGVQWALSYLQVT